MVVLSGDVVGELDRLAKSNNSLEKVICYLKNMNADSQETLALVVSLIESCNLITDSLILRYADSAGKIISAAIISAFLYTPASAAFLSTACYFLVNSIATILLKQEVNRASMAQGALTGACNEILKMMGERSFPNLSELHADYKELSRIIRENLESKNIFCLSAMAGTFIGANLGANLGLSWVGKSIINLSCSLATARYIYSFWNIAEPGSAEEYVRQYACRPIL